MKINVNQILTQLDGTPIIDVKDGQAVEANMKLALVNAVLSPTPNETGVEKVKKYELAKKIYQAKDEVELTAEEVLLAQKRVSDVFAPLIVGQILEVLK